MVKVTQFMDMHSGGGQKLDWQYIYIEAPLEEAKIIFFNRFKRNPSRVTCTCCGDDYSITESSSLREATAFERNCRYAYFKGKVEVPEDKAWIRGKGIQKGCKGKYVEEEDRKKIDEMKKKYPEGGWEGYYKYITINEYKKKKSVLIIYKKDIKPEERKGDIPEEGYVWQGS